MFLWFQAVLAGKMDGGLIKPPVLLSLQLKNEDLNRRDTHTPPALLVKHQRSIKKCILLVMHFKFYRIIGFECGGKNKAYILDRN